MPRLRSTVGGARRVREASVRNKSCHPEEHGVQHESWGPFAEGRNNLFSDPTLTDIGEAHGKSVAQVVLGWLTQRNIVVIPKSVRRERMEQNFDIFDFELTEEEMSRIARMDTNDSLFFSHQDPAMVRMIGGRRPPD
jgi:2,5-diketo-D-gluconate reductase A